MTTCIDNVCGTGDWTGPKPGDPNLSDLILTATPAFGGIDVAWSYPTINSAAVAHTLLFRSEYIDTITAMQIAVVSGNSYYDKQTVGKTFYYWIRMVSVNGTIGDLIGPASATANPLIGDMITRLTGQIDASVLAQSLKTDIDRITLNASDIQLEVLNRTNADNVLGQAVNSVQAGLDNAITLLNTEVTARTSGQDALITQYDLLAAANQSNAAAIQTETTARVTEDSALATRIDNVVAANGTNAAAIQTETTARTTEDTNLASQITTAQSTLDGRISSVQTTLQTNINTTDGKVTNIGALYTAKVSVDGLVGGFGVYNDGTTVDAGFDVDTFWVGKTQANKRKPFIISNGVTYINDAVIEKLTFSKLRDESGNFVVENGKVKANYINVQTAIMGGAFNSYNWPAAGQQGFYLGPEGFLIGNANNGKYLQLTSGGDLYAPGFSIVNGAATFSGALSAASGSFSGTLTATAINAVSTVNIAGNSVTTAMSSTGTGSAAVSFTVPTGEYWECINLAFWGTEEATQNSSGATYGLAGAASTSSIPLVQDPGDGYYKYWYPSITMVSVTGHGAGNHTITASGGNGGAPCTLSVFLRKR